MKVTNDKNEVNKILNKRVKALKELKENKWRETDVWKVLEKGCEDCLQIVMIHDNGDVEQVQ